MIPNKYITRIIIGIVILAALFELGSTCRCLQLSLQDKYCQSDFVLKVLVKSNLTNLNGQQDFNDFYTIDILEQWKFNFAHKVNTKKRVYTGSSGACRVYLEKGKVYLISGKVNQTARRMEMNSCSAIVEMAPLSLEASGLKTNPPVCA